MLNQNLKLNSEIFSIYVKQVPIRQGFGDGLVEAGRQNKRGEMVLNELGNI